MRVIAAGSRLPRRRAWEVTLRRITPRTRRSPCSLHPHMKPPPAEASDSQHSRRQAAPRAVQARQVDTKTDKSAYSEPTTAVSEREYDHISPVRPSRAAAVSTHPLPSS